MHFHGPAPHVEGSDVVRGVRFKNVSPVSWSCYPPGSQPRKDGVRLHNSYDISGSVLQVALYLWRGHLSPSQEGGALLLNKIPTSNIVSLCQYSRVSRGRIWRWPGRRKLIHLPGIFGWLQQMGSLGSWPRIAWSRHAIRMFRDRNLGLISVLRNQIGSYTELNHFGQEALFCFEAKNQVLSELIQKSPNGPKMAPNDQKYVILIILDHFGPS